MQKKAKGAYSADCLPKKDKLELSMLIGLFFSFNLMFFAPFDFYLSNAGELLINVKYVLGALIPATVIVFIAVFAICGITHKRYHIFAVSMFFAIGLAMYIQGNFLSLNLKELDGTVYKPGAIRMIINLLIWAAIISVPFLIYKFNRKMFNTVLKYGSCLILVVEIITICLMFISIKINDDPIGDVLSNSEEYLCTSLDEYTYSSGKNYIIILVDEYDSFIFDAASNAEPDCVSGFDGFTYYTNTLGMYGLTADAVPYIFTRKYREEPAPYENDLVFRVIKENYKMNIYAFPGMFPSNIYTDYADNYIKKKITIMDHIRIDMAFNKAAMFRCMPEAFKSLFWLYSDEFDSVYSSGEIKSYYGDDLAFYNDLKRELDITEENCFKYIYLYGLHNPLNINSEMQRVDNGAVDAEEQAIALNKILSEYFDILKENGVYDNSEIILLADHGMKGHDNGEYPLLMIKRAGETGEGITVSNAPISHSDLYPTLLYLAGYDPGEDTIFDIEEDEERTRYFALSDEYITGNIKGEYTVSIKE